MSHRFETGFPFAKRTMLRRWAVSTLSALARPAGYLRAVVPFAAVVRSWTDGVGIELLQKAAISTPAIAVAVGTVRESELTVGQLKSLDECELVLYFVSQQSRDMLNRLEPDIAAMADDHADPGLEIAMEHATELLKGQYPVAGSIKLKQLVKRSEEELVSTPAVTIWTQTWRCAFLEGAPHGRNAPEFRTAPQLLKSIHWRVTTPAQSPTFDPAFDPNAFDVGNDPVYNEVQRPAPATNPTSIDVDSDNL